MLVLGERGAVYREMEIVGRAVVHDRHIGIPYQIHVVAEGALHTEFGGLFLGLFLRGAGNRNYITHSALAYAFDVDSRHKARADHSRFQFSHTFPPYRARSSAPFFIAETTVRDEKS